MKIIQMVPCLSYGDAISNDMIALDAALQKNGYDSYIYTETIADRRVSADNVILPETWEKLSSDDVIIYHIAVAWHMIDWIIQANCRKIAVYHNITPAHFYRGYNDVAYSACNIGLEEVKRLNNAFDYCLADSEFNKEDLVSYGYSCPIDVLPILIPFGDYQKKPDQSVIGTYSGLSGHNILFVGRVVPNKKFEDVIVAFAMYKKYYDSEARLFLVGSFQEEDIYYRRLKSYIAEIGVNDVIFPGHIPFSQILAYYHLADLFLCMSEHEGFCVPLIEAMCFDKPIIAYDCTAIGGTLNGSGILLKEKNPLETAGVMNYVLSSEQLKSDIIIGERKRLRDFDHDVIEKQFINDLKSFLEN